MEECVFIALFLQQCRPVVMGPCFRRDDLELGSAIEIGEVRVCGNIVGFHPSPRWFETRSHVPRPTAAVSRRRQALLPVRAPAPGHSRWRPGRTTDASDCGRD